MDTILSLLGLWFLLSVPVSLLLGRFLALSDSALEADHMTQDQTLPTRSLAGD